jgi:HD-GYP domain-containing protein (c-di-GMP phosphodiesterase class II)
MTTNDDRNRALEDKISRLELLYKVGIALSAEKNKDRLVEMILLEAKQLCHADGGTLYLRDDEDRLRFAIMRTDSLGIALGGTTGKPIELPPIPLFDPATGAPNKKNVATFAVVDKRSVNVPDAYDADGFDFSGTKAFDKRNQYRSRSFLTIPLVNNEDVVIGVLQLLNARDPATGEVVPFREDHQRIVEALASQAAIALDNQILLDGQKELLESFIKMIAAAIDAKSPYTGGHCERVPILTEMLARAACEAADGPLKSFALTDDEWYELKIAAWLHDCGKVTTPVHVMDKATKLETIADRIETVRARFEVLKRDAELACLQAIVDGVARETANALRDAKIRALDEDLAFIEKANVGGEFLPPDAQDRISAIGARTFIEKGAPRRLLSDDEVSNLRISRGTLNDDERIIINGHMVQTIRMLEALPFPRHLRRVPEYAGGHHEKMDGAGYPKGIYGGDMSIPARIMAIADVFEALTAQDRPYKKGKTLSESMKIMSFMKKDNHLDPALFDLFVKSGVYKEYGAKFLPKELIDDVDEQALLAVQPKPFSSPEDTVRKSRWQDFLPEYRHVGKPLKI